MSSIANTPGGGADVGRQYTTTVLTYKKIHSETLARSDNTHSDRTCDMLMIGDGFISLTNLLIDWLCGP